MKRIIFLICLGCVVFFSYAQQTVLVNESFNSIPSGWTVSPTSSWSTNNIYAVSSPNSAWGFVPNSTGDSVELISPWYDFSSYAYAFLQFNHICKVTSSDICNIKYQELGMPSWKTIPTSSYLGSDANAYRNNQFSHESYSIWIPTDSLALPSNSWWKEEVFDISNEVSYAHVRFKFSIKKGNVLGTQFAYGWLIDNFKITASVYEIKPPVVEFLTNYSDTVYNTGPFTIRAKAATRTLAPIIQPVRLAVSYTYNNITTYDTLNMTPVEGDSIYSVTIPQKLYGTTVSYSIYAEDTVGNNSSAFNGFYIKRPSAGQTGSVIVGTGTSTDYRLPMDMYYCYSWTRQIYLSNEISQASVGGLITKLGWQYAYGTPYTYTNQSCYLRAVDDVAITSNTYEDPITAGATLVWSGTINLSQGWCDINFTTPFLLPPGKNLMVYWHHEHGTYPGTAYVFNYTTTANNQAVYCRADASFPSGNSGSITNMRSNARFYVVGSTDDSNSVALLRIENPTEHVVAGQNTPIVPTIKNKGFANLDSCIINYSINGVVQTPFHWTGSLPDDFNSTDTIGYFVPRLNEYDTLVIWVSMPNGVIDSTTYDDTMQIITYGCQNLLSGDYIVGLDTGADYSSLSEFFSILSLCGSLADITLKFQDGVYAENWDLSNLGNLMGNNTLTITSLNGDPEKVILRPPSGAGIILNNTENLIIEGITIDAATSGICAIIFTGPSNDIIIRNNKLYANGNLSNSSYAVIYKTSGNGLLDNIRIIGNYIDGGYYGICLYGNNTGLTNYNTNLYIDSNEITNAYYYSTFLYYSAVKSVSNNNISSGTTTKSGYFYGVRSYYCDFERILNNTIYTRTAMNVSYGIYSYYLNITTTGMSNALYANNEIRLYGTSTIYGMYLYYANVDVINNSIYANTNSSTYGLYTYGGSTSYINNIKNNNIVCTYSSAYPIYISATTVLSVWTMDYNNYYAPSYVGYCGSTYNTISTWQSATSQDLHSVSVAPNFYNINNSLLLLDEIGLECPMDSSVMTDIKNVMRDTSTTMGCYHFVPKHYDVFPSEVFSPQSASVLGTSTPLTVAIYNLGVDTITSMQIGWEVNGVAQTPYSWTGSLAQHDTIIVNVGNFMPIAKNNTIRIYTYAPNSQPDEDVSNDTILINTYGCQFVLSGTYTVGGTGADFADITEVTEALQYCGLSGPVVFKLDSGYYGNLSFASTFPGVSNTNTVTFTSASGNANDVVIGSGGIALTLTDAEHLVFKNLTFGDTTDNTTYGVQLTGMCYNIEISECNIYSSITTTTSSYAAVNCDNVNQPKYLREVRFLNNNIRGGYYGMRMYYICGNSTSYISLGSVVVDGNKISDAYYYGMYNYYYGRFYSISDNIIKSRSTSGGYYGIYSYQYKTVDTMRNNKIHINCSSTAYGMYLYGYHNYTTSYGAKGPMYIANNEIIISNNSTAYGIYDNSGSSYSRLDLLHNSIYITNNTTTYGIRIYPYSSSYKYTVLNNNVYLNTSSTGYLLYFGSTSYMSTSYCNVNYNNYYKPSGTAYYGSSSYSSLSTWQSAYSQDYNSTNVNPSYVNPMLELIPTVSLLCPVLSNVQKDIVGSRRVSSNNNKGCYTIIYSRDAGIDAFLSPLANISVGTTNQVSVRLKNYGTTTLTSVTINWEVGGVTQAPVSLSGLSLPKFKDTLINLGTFVPSVPKINVQLKAWTSSPNGSTDNFIYNDTASIAPFVCDTALNGLYTIGSGGDYADVNTAIQYAINCGISGPVTFAFLSGNYSSIYINDLIPGTDANNTITFTSASGNSSDVVIGSSGTALLLNRTGNLMFKNLTIGLTSSTTTYGVEFQGMCENILFYGCNINTYATATSSSYAAVYYNNSSGSSDYLKDVHFIKNNINGGYYNMYLYYPAGSTTNMTPNGMSVIIDSNNLTNAYYYGIYSYYYGRYPSISYNTVTSRSSSSSSTWYGIYIYYYHNVDALVGNKVISTNTSISTLYGIRTYYYYNYTSYSGSGAGLIANNEVRTYGNSSVYGMYVYMPYSNVNVVHNSVYITGNATGYGIYLYNSNTSYRPLIKNNVFAVNANTSSYPVYYNSSYYNNSYFDVDYNNYYSTGSNVGYASSAVTTLANLQMATQQDVNSLSENPNFINPTVNLHTSGNTMIVSPIAVNDMDGVIRPRITNMGCYHDYVPLDVDLKLDALVSPAGRQLTPHVQIPIVVRLYNLGGDTITSCQIEWSINNVAQTTYNWTGSLPYLDTISVQIGTYTFNSGLSTIEINTTYPNQGADSNLLNDTIITSIVGCDSAFSGVYTVGSPTSDYATLDEALFMLQECGLSSDVELQLESGTYDAMYFTGAISGSGSGKTVTITSRSGNPASVVIRNASGGVALTLNNAKYMKFKNVTIGTTDNTTTYGVQFIGLCEEIDFYGCNIYSSITTTSSSYAAVFFTGSGDNYNTLRDVSFIKNNVSGGYYNMYFYHSGGSVSTTVAGSITIDSNTLSNAYYSSIYTYCIWYFPSISYNKITNRSSNSSFYGLYIYYYTTVDSVVGNRIHISNTTSTTYGIYAYYYLNYNSWGTGGPLFAANNEVIITNASSTVYGIYTGGTSTNTKADFLFNSVYISSSSTTYGLYRGYCSSSYMISMKNNNIYVTNPTGTVYILYVYSSYESTSYGSINYNNYYRDGGGTTYFGNSSYTSLATWRNAYSQDMNSGNAQPVFIDPTQNLELADYGSMMCPNVGVLADIKGERRTTYTTIGAYTVFIYNGKNVGLLDLLEPINTDQIGCYQDYANVKFSFANRGNVDAEFYSTPITFRLRVTGAINYQKDSILTFGKMTPTVRDTFTLTQLLPVAISGTYNITLWLEMPGDAYHIDDTLRSVFIVDKVSIPYATNFDSVPNGLVFNQILGTSSWSVESGQGTNPIISPVCGTGRLQFSSESSRGSLASVTFQPFNLQGTVQPRFKLWYAHDDANPGARDYTDVKISIDGGNTYSTILHLQRYNAAYTTPAFVRYEIDLTPYAQYSCVIFSLEAGSFAGGNQNIDSVVIISKQDISLSLDIPDQSDFVACELDNQSIIANITNRTSQRFDFNEYPSQINVVISGAIDSVFTIPLTSGSINGDTTLSYLISNTFDFSKNGTYNIMAYLDAADDNYLNDTVRETRVINVNAQLISIDSIGIKNIGDQVYPTIHLTNIGNIPINDMPAKIYINNVLMITEPIDSLINPGDTLTYTFTSPFTVPTATLQQPFYQLRIFLDLPCDGVPANNSIVKYNSVHIPLTVDMNITAVNYPTADSCEWGFAKVYPSIDIENLGNNKAQGAVLHISVDSAGVEIEKLTDNLPDVDVQETITFVSTKAYTVPNMEGNYTVHFNIEMNGDIDTTNNKRSAVACAKEKLSVANINTVAWELGQNIPNPASNLTQIPYMIPQDGQISFKVMSINGQVLYTSEMQVLAGSYILDFDATSLSGGIYYYSMEYQGQRIVKKMTIQR